MYTAYIDLGRCINLIHRSCSVPCASFFYKLMSVQTEASLDIMSICRPVCHRGIYVCHQSVGKRS